MKTKKYDLCKKLKKYDLCKELKGLEFYNAGGLFKDTKVAQEHEIGIWFDKKNKEIRKATLKEVLSFMTYRDRLEIPSVQDNWIKTVRMIKAEIKELEK